MVWADLFPSWPRPWEGSQPGQVKETLQCQDEDGLMWEHQLEVLAHPEDLNSVLGRGVDCVIPYADFPELTYF